MTSLENMTKKVHSLLPDFLFLLALSFVYLLIRLYHLTSLPVFGDEAIYLRWSQIIKSVETLRFLPLTDGKQPLYMWLVAASYHFFTHPLIAGRLVSTLFGLSNLIGIYLIAQIYLRPSIARISAILYLLLPATFFFDRLALPDTLLSALGTWCLLFTLLLSHQPRLDLTLILGGLLGLSWLTKSPAIYFLVLSTLTFFAYRPQNIRYFYFPIIFLTLGFSIYNILRLGPQFSQIALRNRDYVWSLSELLQHPLDPFLPHLTDILHIYSQQISWYIILPALIGLWLYFQKKPTSAKTSLVLFSWYLLPLAANMAIAKVFTARYVLFTLPPLIILLATGLDQLLSRFKNLHYLLLAAILVPNLVTLSNLSSHPFTFKPTSTEKGYFSDWTSGWGIKEAAEYLISRSLSANVIVGSEGYFGTLPDGLQIYTNNTPRLTVFGVGIDLNVIPEKLLDARAHQDEVYLLFNRSRLKLPPDALSQLELVHNYPKPDGDELVLLRLK